jgi:hypothetical protein
VPNLGEVAQATSKGKNVREVLHRLTEVWEWDYLFLFWAKIST